MEMRDVYYFVMALGAFGVSLYYLFIDVKELRSIYFLLLSIFYFLMYKF